MKKLMLSVLDIQTRLWTFPVYSLRKEAAIRDFAHWVNHASDENPMYNNPQDFQLYLLGEFDDETAMMDIHVPELITTGLQCKNAE